MQNGSRQQSGTVTEAFQRPFSRHHVLLRSRFFRLPIRRGAESELVEQPTRDRQSRILVASLELAVDHQLPQVVLDRPNPWSRTTPEQAHEVCTIEWAGDSGDVFLSAELLDSPLQL